MWNLRGSLIVLAGAGLACSESASVVPDPFLPANLAELDVRVRERIREARARVESSPEDARAWGEMAMICEAERLHTLALACLHEAGERDPGEPRWPYREGCVLSALGRFEEAARAMEASIALEPSYAPSHWRLGTYHAELGDTGSARRSFARAIELDPTFPGGWFGLARVHLLLEESTEALEVLERLRELEPENPQVRLLVASARRQAGLPVVLEDLPSSGSDEVPVWNDPWEREARAFHQGPLALQAGRLLQSGDAQGALKLLEEARASGADQGDLALRFARAYLRLGRTQDAERELGALLAREPRSTRAHMMLADIRAQHGDLPGQLAELEEVLRVEPDHGPALVEHGMALYRRGELERAAASITRAIELGPVPAEARYTLAQALLALQRWEQARSRFRALLDSAPDHGDAWAGLARALLELGDLAGCAEALAQAGKVGVEQRASLDDVESRLEQERARRDRQAAREGAGSPESGQDRR